MKNDGSAEIPADESVKLAHELADVLTHVQRTFVVDLSTQTAQNGISIPQYLLLSFLFNSEGITMSKLAELMEHTSPATTGLVDRLVSGQFVERFGNEKDRRQVLVRITPKGKDLVNKIKRNTVYHILEIAKELDSAKMQAWLEIYTTIKKWSVSRGEPE